MKWFIAVDSRWSRYHLLLSCVFFFSSRRRHTRWLNVLEFRRVLFRSALLRFMEESGCGIVSPAMREGPLDYELDSYAAEFTAACRTATRSGFLGPCMLVRRVVFDAIGLFDERFIYGGCEDVDFLWRAQKAEIKAAMTGSAFIHHFGMITQNTVKHTESKAYPAQNMADFRRKWGRTVRGNWLQRRWARMKERWTERYERFRYGHTLIE